MIENKWAKQEYQRIRNVTQKEEKLLVSFEDGSLVEVGLENILAPDITNPDWKSLEFNPYEIIIPTSDRQLEISWTTIRLLSDPEFAAFWSHQAEEQSKDVGNRLIELRKKRNLTAKEVATRAGISPQSLSRIEKGYHDIVFTTLRKILAAMGYSLRDLASVEVEPPLLQNIIKKLEKAGAKKEWIIRRLLVNPQITNSVMINSNLEEYIEQNEVFNFIQTISKVFGISNETLQNSKDLSFSLNLLQPIRLKADSKLQEKQATAYALYAHYIALLVLDSFMKQNYYPIPKDPDQIREEIKNSIGPLNYENVLHYVWDKGIPVVPLADSGIFHGASWNVSNRFVIVLKQITRYQGRWLFDLCHELGHIALHLSGKNRGVIELKEITPFNKASEEQEASDFAKRLLLSGKSDELAQKAVEIALGKTENLKSAVVQVAASEKVSPDILANYLAFRLYKENNMNWWGPANNLQIAEPSPWNITKQMLLKRIDPKLINPADLYLLQKALEN
jgi:transcriptional regulator with XRE-family HTH domain/Zn-dependent peptidase ImmA (M78 family)